MFSDETFVDVAPLIPQLEAIAGLLLAPAPPAVMQQGAGEQIRQLIENVAALPRQENVEEQLGWMGLCDGPSVDLIREDVQISAAIDASGQVLWADLHHESGAHWHLSFEGLGSGMSPLEKAPAILDETRMLIEISTPDGDVSSTQFKHDGQVVDCLDIESGYEAAMQHFQDSVAVFSGDEDGGAGEESIGGGTEGPADAGVGGDLPGGGLGEGMLRGAVAGLAGAAVAAGAAAIARKKGSSGLESAEPPKASVSLPDSQPPAATPPPLQEQPAEPPPMPAPALPKDVEWHYVSMGEKYGPIPEADLKKYLKGGNLSPDTLVWRPGLESWRPAQDIPEFGLGKPEVTPPAEVETQWFYAVGEQQVGPVSETDLKAWLKSAQLPASILVWKAEMSQWLPASSIPGLWG